MSSLALASLVVLSAITRSAAQTTDAQCLPFYSWTNNSHKQSPCQVAATLISVCTPSFNVAGLPDGTHYVGPSKDLATPCQCNTVVYSLMSACGACQGRTYSAWSEWTANCPSVSVGSYPEALPPNTYVPAWAYLDVQTNDRFNETAARLAVNGTEHAAPVSSTSSTLVKSTSTRSGSVKTTSAHSTSVVSTSATLSSTAVTSNATSSTSAASSASDPRLNTIVGGTVGGVLGLAMIVTVAIWLVIRHRERRARFGMTLPSSSTVSESAASPEPGDQNMAQYVANTVPRIITPSVTTTSLPSPTSARFPSASASVSSVGPSNV